MNQKTLNWTVGIVFSLISAVHLIRSILEWKVKIGSVEIPTGVSVVAFLLSGFIAYSALKLAYQKQENRIS